MEVKVQIPFEELVAIIKQLSPVEKDKLKKELIEQHEPIIKKSKLTELLLNGPVFSEDQIKGIEETRKSINQWRTRPLWLTQDCWLTISVRPINLTLDLFNFLTFWNELLSEIIVLPFDSKAAHVAAEIQQELKKIRKTVEKADLFIAATAISNNLSLDTLNRKHFEVIEQLALFSTSG
jgi:hypothetical protein